jgi:hypothetical protein
VNGRWKLIRRHLRELACIGFHLRKGFHSDIGTV